MKKIINWFKKYELQIGVILSMFGAGLLPNLLVWFNNYLLDNNSAFVLSNWVISLTQYLCAGVIILSLLLGVKTMNKRKRDEYEN